MPAMGPPGWTRESASMLRSSHWRIEATEGSACRPALPRAVGEGVFEERLAQMAGTAHVRPLAKLQRRTVFDGAEELRLTGGVLDQAVDELAVDLAMDILTAPVSGRGGRAAHTS